jgi:hypothetical protein
MSRRSTTVRRAFILAACGLFVGALSAAAQPAAQDVRSVIGELRLIAIDPANPLAVDALHHSGWMEADGRLLRRDDFPELFATVGLAWTKRKTAPERFAVPDLVERKSAISSDNPYGVLGPGDLVSGGRPLPTPPAPQYFIYVGREVSASLALAATDRTRPSKTTAAIH